MEDKEKIKKLLKEKGIIEPEKQYKEESESVEQSLQAIREKAKRVSRI
ncbi:hypothetical protein MSIBF_A2440003 [groundwater metagenome]|uniref:Uncharacterized protein n=1 Tax=groundwater metagenome TaxID=717931 RepID=A0A098EBY4_9ZZZZ